MPEFEILWIKRPEGVVVGCDGEKAVGNRPAGNEGNWEGQWRTATLYSTRLRTSLGASLSVFSVSRMGLGPCHG